MPSVHQPSLSVTRLVGTPHNVGAAKPVNELRRSLKALAAALANSGWADEHPFTEAVECEAIDLIAHLGPAERHALRIVISLLVKIALRNGYHA